MTERTFTAANFERRCEVAAVALEDRLLRYVSSPQEHDLALPTLMPFVLFKLARLEGKRP